jgi:hypothetical protein
MFGDLNIIVRIPSADTKLLMDLKLNGIDASIRKNPDYPEDDEILIRTCGTSEIDERSLPADSKYYVEAFEEGGGYTNSGNAKIISDRQGKKLIPEQVYTSGHLACGVHARFIHDAVCIVTSNRIGYVNIYGTAFTNKLAYVKLETVEVWSGLKKDLPNSYAFMASAVEAAHNKANCYHCREPHFVQAQN